MTAFLDEQGIQAVLGEQTFAVEMLAGFAMAARGGAVLTPHVVRIPSARVGLFRGHLQEELVAHRPTSDADRAEAAALLESFRRDRPRPEYFLRNAKTPRPQAAWPRKFGRHLRLAITDRHDATHVSPTWLVRLRVGEVANALAHRVRSPYQRPALPPPRPFVLYPLHRQPEASIDVLGARLSNQVEVVRAMARTLPATHELYVKEHPNGLGDRSPAALAELAALPGVRLIDPGVSTFVLADAADLVVTVSGTASYEAALLGRSAATLVPMFFGSILRANGFNPFVGSLADLLTPRDLDDDARVALLADVLARSGPGLIDNPSFAPAVMDPANLDAVARAIAPHLASRSHR
ncbi:MAG: hypothetical protein R2939_02060 [Kofleriaceae bacterium]